MKKVEQQNRRRKRVKENFYQTKIYRGTLLIPDISGFTKFVRSTDMMTGKNITSRLLSSIIRSNYLGLQVSEIEGDAILFYKYEKKFSVEEILGQYEVMLESFNQELALLSEELGREINLTLKLIAHYGKLAYYKIGKFRKLYGETVIEAHRLLKNSIDSNTYVLITDDLLEKDKCEETITNEEVFKANRKSNMYADLRNIWVTFFDYELRGLQKLVS